jgi:NAD(P)H-dependent FMN reductase
MSTRILALVGSLRSGSDNLRLAEAAASSRPAHLGRIFDRPGRCRLVQRRHDQPGPSRPPTGLRAEVQSADALLLVTPEYNGTMSAALPNAIDWISRPSAPASSPGNQWLSSEPHTASTAGYGRTTTRASQHASRGKCPR